MRPAEGRQEIVERLLVRQVDDAEPDAKFRPVGVQQVVGTDPKIEEIVGGTFRRNPPAWRRPSIRE